MVGGWFAWRRSGRLALHRRAGHRQAIGIVGVALAAWTTNGTGSGTAASRSAENLVVTDGLSAETLFPTGAADVKLSIENPNDYAVQVSAIDLNGDGIEASDEDCNVASVTFDDDATSRYIAPGATIDVTLTDALHMSNAANDDCQSNTFTVNVDVTGASTATV